MSNQGEAYQNENEEMLESAGNQLPALPGAVPEEASVETEAPEVTNKAVRPIPRVSIQVFCESSDTGEVFQRASEDRRLSKAHMTVQMGGVAGAVEHFGETSTPNLVIVETSANGEKLFDQLAKLAGVCNPNTKVIVIGQVNDITTYRELIQQGVNEYLVAPLTPLQILEAISSLYIDPDAPPVGRNIVFTGAKGGVGSSSLAHNVAWCISDAAQEEVVIVDLDLPFGTAGLDFNQDPAQGIGDALTAPERVDEVLLDRLLVKCSERLSLFTSPGTLDREFDLEPGSFEIVLDVVRKTVPYVIIDLPHIWTAWSRSVLLSADDIVIVATPDLASLRNTKNLFERVKVARPNDPPPRLVLNQVGVAKRPEIPAKDFAEAIGTEPQFVIPFDAALFGIAANNGQMLPQVDSKSQTVGLIKEIAAALTGYSAPEVKKTSFLSLFTGKKRSA